MGVVIKWAWQHKGEKYFLPLSPPPGGTYIVVVLQIVLKKSLSYKKKTFSLQTVKNSNRLIQIRKKCSSGLLWPSF